MIALGLSEDWVTLFQKYCNILQMMVIIKPKAFVEKKKCCIICNKQLPLHLLFPLLTENKTTKQNKKTKTWTNSIIWYWGVRRTWGCLSWRQNIRITGIYCLSEKNKWEGKIWKKIWRGYRTLESKNIQLSSTLRHLLCLLFYWELFHLQTPNVLLFPKRHCADIFSEGIIYMSDESKNLPPQKKSNQIPTDSFFSDKFLFAALPLFIIETLWRYSSPMLKQSLCNSH